MQQCQSALFRSSIVPKPNLTPFVYNSQGDYKQFPGMFPHAAGLIASHGPYTSVKEIYKIDGITDNDKKLFKKYENEFTANPPGRSFSERINSRFST
jgi:photosystem II PsbU protein